MHAVSFIFLTISNSAEVCNLTPLLLKRSYKRFVTSLPAKSILPIEWGKLNPLKTGTTWVTPSPESNTQPVVLALAYL